METETVPTVHPWLRQFPPEAQPLILAWFAYAIGQGSRTPETVLTIVERVVSRKLDWSITVETRQACSLTLLALCHQRPLALDYAATLLERRPPDPSEFSHHG